MVIMSVDPGTINCGVVFWKLNNKLNIESIDTINIKLSDNLDVFMRILELENIVKDLITKYQPVWLVIEAGFINKFRPQAYGPISNTIFAIKKQIYEFNRLPTFTEIPPKKVKQLIGATGSGDKDAVKKAVGEISEITDKVNLDTLTEHQVDALAIGYVFINELRKNMWFLLMKII